MKIFTDDIKSLLDETNRILDRYQRVNSRFNEMGDHEAELTQRNTVEPPARPRFERISGQESVAMQRTNPTQEVTDTALHEYKNASFSEAPAGFLFKLSRTIKKFFKFH
jgi:hypothetical protein